MNRIIHHLPALLIALYGIAVACFLLIRWLIGEPTPVEWVNRFLPLILMPALILLPLCLLRRRVRLAFVMLPAVWTFGVYYAPLFLPNAYPPLAAPQLTIATYNIGARTTWIEPLTENIRALDVDVIGLQEMSQQAAAIIAPALADVYPYMALHPHNSPYFGYGILSRYSITDDYAYPIEPDRLRLQRAQIDFDGRSVTIFNFHAQPVSESWRPPDVMVRRAQVWRLIEEAAQITAPRILLGDFNLNEQSQDYRDILAGGFADAFYQAGWGMGFTNPVWGDLEQPPTNRNLLALVPPHRRIDFVFYDGHFQAARAEVWPQPAGSDHFPLLAALAFLNP